MEKLNTIQKHNNLNTVYMDGEAGPGGARHDYVVSFGGGLPESDGDGVHIRFQAGPRKDPESQKGVCNTGRLEIVRDRMKGFQAGPFPCEENDEVIKHLEAALEALKRRTNSRFERGVLGKEMK